MSENKTEKFDIVIIGSGVSGSLIATKLAEANIKNNINESVKILMLEAGPGEYENEKSDNERLSMVDTFINAQHKTPGSPYFI